DEPRLRALAQKLPHRAWPTLMCTIHAEVKRVRIDGRSAGFRGGDEKCGYLRARPSLFRVNPSTGGKRESRPTNADCTQAAVGSTSLHCTITIRPLAAVVVRSARKEQVTGSRRDETAFACAGGTELCMSCSLPTRLSPNPCCPP